MIMNLRRITALGLLTTGIIASANADLLHPVCMERLLSGPEAPANPVSIEAITHDLSDCQKQHQNLPFEKLSKYQARFRRPENSTDKSLPYFVEYKIIGTLANRQTLVQISSHYGGTQSLSGGLIITDHHHGKKRKVTVHQGLPGGDRCFGGIKKLAITAPDKIEIQRRITTDELLRLNSSKNDPEPVEGVASCAICCIGHTTEWLEPGSAAQLRQVTLNQTQAPQKFSRNQACFNELTGEVSEQRPQVLNPEQLQQLQKQFNRQCHGEKAENKATKANLSP